jgi:hypothetical protein
MAKSVAAATTACTGVRDAVAANSNTALVVGQAMLDSISACTLELQAPATSAFTAVAGALHPIDSSGGSFSIAPPAVPALNDIFGVLDLGGMTNVNPVSVTFGAQKLMGVSQGFSFDFPYAVNFFIYSGATNGWLIKG